MIKVEIPERDKRVYDIIFDYNAPIDGRPFDYDDEQVQSYAYLSDKHHKWLKDSDIPYRIFEDQSEAKWHQWFILFENESDAVLFKLTWCGNQ